MPMLQPVDQLVVDIAIDNLTDSYSSKPANVSPEFDNVMAAGATEISGTTLCCAGWGWLVMTATVGKHRRKFLFDTGPEGAIFLRNCRNLGIVLDDVAAIAISHGHWDHTGGLLDVLDQITRNQRGKEVECHVNPGMFLERGTRLDTGQVAPFAKVASLDELAAEGAAGRFTRRARNVRRLVLPQRRDTARVELREGAA